MVEIKKIVLFIVCMVLMIPTIVFAEADYSYRAQKANKVKLNINNVDIYFCAILTVNISKDNSYKEFIPINDIDVSYTNGVVYLKIKRSTINNILRSNKYDSVSAYLAAYGDYLDLDKTKNYYYFWQGFEDNGEYFYESYQANFLTREYNVFEVYNMPFDLVGFDANAINTGNSNIMLFETDQLSDIYEDGSVYKKSEIDMNRDRLVLNINKKYRVEIIEDEKLDMGSNNNVVINKETTDENGNYVLESTSMDMNNFYAEYFENNKLNYSWTFYDSDGNPKELDINTSIRIDDSENEEQILYVLPQTYFNLKDRIKIISFEHEGDLGGVAKISLYVGDKFQPGDILRLYYYDPEKELLKEQRLYTEDEIEHADIPVDDEGYVVLTLTHCSEYVLTDTEIAQAIDDNNELLTTGSNSVNSNSSYLFYSLLGVGIFASSVYVWWYYKKRKVDNKIA